MRQGTHALRKNSTPGGHLGGHRFRSEPCIVQVNFWPTRTTSGSRSSPEKAAHISSSTLRGKPVENSRAIERKAKIPFPHLETKRGQIDSRSGNAVSISGNEIEVKSQQSKGVSKKATTLIPKSLSNYNKASAANPAASHIPSLDQISREHQIPTPAKLSDREVRQRADQQKADLDRWLKTHPADAPATRATAGGKS